MSSDYSPETTESEEGRAPVRWKASFLHRSVSSTAGGDLHSCESMRKRQLVRPDFIQEPGFTNWRSTIHIPCDRERDHGTGSRVVVKGAHPRLSPRLRIRTGICCAERVPSSNDAIGESTLLRMAVGQTDELDGEFAAQEILRQCADALGGHEPQAGLLLASHGLDFEEFLSVIATAYPGMDLIGCTTMAPMSSVSDYVEGSTTLTLFASDVLEFTAGLGTDVAAGVAFATRQAVEEATHKTDKQPALLIVTPSVEKFDPAAITFEIGEALGRAVPVFGGGAAPDFPMAMPWLGGI